MFFKNSLFVIVRLDRTIQSGMLSGLGKMDSPIKSGNDGLFKSSFIEVLRNLISVIPAWPESFFEILYDLERFPTSGNDMTIGL